MGKASKSLKAFISSIPDSALNRLPLEGGTIYINTDFRLDMQGMTSAQEHNLQVQINKGTTISTLKKFAPQTVAGPVLVPSEDPWAAEDIRAKLLASVKI
ncbi:hypothetical protein CC79DRAFT_1398762 [Sarocladium strictum]